MAKRKVAIAKLSEMAGGQEADFFALLSDKQQLTTRDGKPYLRVTFRDDRREVSFPIWSDSPWAAACRDQWNVGDFYKIRATLRETQFGLQLEIRKIRETTDADAEDGFDPGMCCASSRHDAAAMYRSLVELIETHVTSERLRAVTLDLLEEHREAFVESAAARRHHHAYRSGLLEHTLSVAQNAAFLAEKYASLYGDLAPPLDRSMVVAGAVLHDIGKVRELAQLPTGAEYTADGELIGHLLLGRDMVREKALELGLDEDQRLRLEHLIIAHQRLPEWGSPKPPMTPEALLVHYADDVDAKFNMMCRILEEDVNPGPFTSGKNLLHHRIYRGPDVP